MRDKNLRYVERRIYYLARNGKLDLDEINELKSGLRKLKRAVAIKDVKSMIRAVSTICKVVMR